MPKLVVFKESITDEDLNYNTLKINSINNIVNNIDYGLLINNSPSSGEDIIDSSVNLVNKETTFFSDFMCLEALLNKFGCGLFLYHSENINTHHRLQRFNTLDVVKLNKRHYYNKKPKSESNNNYSNSNSNYSNTQNKYNFIKENNIDKVYEINKDNGGLFLLAYSSILTSDNAYQNINSISTNYQTAFTKQEALKRYNENEISLVKIYIDDVETISLINNYEIKCKELTFLNKE